METTADSKDVESQQAQAPAFDAGDSGYSSRKLWFAVGTSVLIFGGAILSGVWRIFGPHYETMISGLIGVLTVYLGGNVSSRWVASKHVQAIASSVEKKVAKAAKASDPEPSPPVEPLPEE